MLAQGLGLHRVEVQEEEQQHRGDATGWSVDAYVSSADGNGVARHTG